MKSSSNLNYLGLCGPRGEYLMAGNGELVSQVLYIHLTWLAGSPGDFFFFPLEILFRAQTLLLSPKSGFLGQRGWHFLWIGYGKGISRLPEDRSEMWPSWVLVLQIQ